MINQSNRQRLMALVAAGLCVIFSAFAVLSIAGFDGAAIRGLTSDLGTVGRGQKFYQHLRVYNCTFTRMSVTVSPTCGCALKGPTTFSIAPMSTTSIVIPYRVHTGPAGRQHRDAIVDYRDGGHQHRRIARVTFLLTG